MTTAAGAAAAVGAAVGAAVVYRAISLEAPITTHQNGGEQDPEPDLESEGTLDLRRQWCLVRAQPTDHAGDVVILPNPAFDVNKTIFGTLDSKLVKSIQAAKIGVKLFWSDDAVHRISTAFTKVPRAPSWSKNLVEFMNNKCDFSTEHADGSFRDHLSFCYEYSARWYQGVSPRVLLLHSILGVGTNLFPMPLEHLPELRSMLTEFEFVHIQMFPTMLRLLYAGELMDELVGYSAEKLSRLSCIRAHRVIDNEKIELSGTDFWIQLNFQLIHLLDFLPTASWKNATGDSFLSNFTVLLSVLRKANKLYATVDFDSSEASNKGGPVMTLGGLVLRTAIPDAVQLWMARRAIRKFSSQIGHSLSYKLEFTPSTTSNL